MLEHEKLPVIIEPYSTFGDEIAGGSPDEIVRNLAAATRTSLAWRCKPRRPFPDLREIFRGCLLTPEAKQDLREVAEVYARATAKRSSATPAPVTTEQPELSLA